MAIRIAAFVITLLINIAVGVAIFFVMMLAMNGFSESDATYGLAAYIVMAVIVTLLMSTLAVVSIQLLTRRGFRGWVSMLIAVPIFSVTGAGLKIACGIIGVLIAEYVRTNH